MNMINIKFPDGSVKEFETGITPYQIAESISSRLAEDVLVAKVDSKMVDLNTPINSDSSLQLFTFKDELGRETYWHSTSHLMAHAIQSIYPEAKFGVGPAIEGGFYYDFDINTTLTEEDLTKIENKMLELAQDDKPFQRRELSKQEALDFFTKVDDKFKLELINEFDENEETISLYHEGNFTDLCRGPHIPSVGKIKYVKLINISGSYWRGDEKRDRLQRIYGVSFPKKKMLEDHLQLLEEAKKRDHRKLGKQLGLFSIEEEAGPGLIYWHPKGASVRNTVENFWREAHIKNGYDLVYSPHIGKSWLWET
ncbi:MAG: TGS domain-containing protein, partial [Ignavibacteriae bacterium]|nr:TGS domain-containing protein [Ignavibacteriota bacterium]